MRPAGTLSEATWGARVSEKVAAARLAGPEADCTLPAPAEQPEEATTQQPAAGDSDLIKTASPPLTPGRKALNVVVHAFQALTPTRRVSSAPAPGQAGAEAAIDLRQLVSRTLPKIRTDRVPSPHWSSHASADPEAAEKQTGGQRRPWLLACCLR
jgi:pyruvate/2-oxoglutarate dehydrogenase complex dihydrolipoamide acyltransferase (E2) component